MSLATYKEKRNFKVTPEPGAVIEKVKKHRFVVQRHDATRLHYDFRLEMGGVLKSWAVPKGPSMNPTDKRLAVMVEDHPVSYIDFYGSIPEGNYGAGTVDIWDDGLYIQIDEKSNPISDKEALKWLADGQLKFVLNGKHLKGEFALVRLKDEKNWLLIKHRDKYAVNGEYSSEDQKPVKVHKKGGVWQSNRAGTQKKTKTEKTAVSKKKPESEEAPETNKPVKFTRFKPGKKLDKYIKPMLASIGDEPFDNPDWLFELKWDGYRAIAECEGNKVKLYSRNGLIFTDRYTDITEELQKLKFHAILDGEIVLMNQNNQPDFQMLQDYEQNREYPLIYYVFDILLNGKKRLFDTPLIERKEILKKLLPKNDVIRFSDHILEHGKAFFKEVKKNNLEGIMAKKIDSEYVSGIRSKEWLKLKNTQAREAIIAGYTEGRGSRMHFGALILGEFKRGKLHYIGHSGTGFTEKKLKEIWHRMQKLKRDTSPFDYKISLNAPVTWIEPKLVAEIKYSEITRDGILRHPVFLHIRDDKQPAEVKPEPEPVHTAEKDENDKKGKNNPGKKKEEDRKETKNEKDKKIVVNNHTIELTNINKIYWPDEKITKGDMINYYEAVADYIVPYLKNRPMSLKRNPNGIKEPGFFHKNAGDIAPSWMSVAPIHSDSGNKTIKYLLCNDKASLLFIANLGCIEMNPWSSTYLNPDNPDWLVIDIDPSDDNTFDEVIETALTTKRILDKAKVDCYCKTSGSSGMHVYIPLGTKYTYDQVKDFANLIAIMVTHELPEITTLERSLSKRSSKKIYVDYLQNRRGQTLASAYSLRPKPGATVSTPLEWKEVKRGLHPSAFDIHNIPARIKKKGDLFKGVLGKAIDIRKALKLLG